MDVLVYEPDGGTREWLGHELKKRACEVELTRDTSELTVAMTDRDYDIVFASYANPNVFRELRAAIDGNGALVALIPAERIADIPSAISDGADDQLLTGLGAEVIDACAHRFGLLSTLRVDLEQLIETKEALAQSEADYRGLFEGAHDAILVFRPDGEVVLDANERACEIYHLTREELIGTSLIALSTDVERGRHLIDMTLEQDGFREYQTIQRRKDGTLVHLAMKAAPVTYRGERAIVSINRDVTSEHLTRQRLERQNRELQDAQRLEALGRLAAGVAHDFNNLLTVISGCAQLMSHRAETELPAEVADILEATEKGAGLVRQLMSFAQRDRAGAEPSDVNELIMSLTPMLKRLAGTRVQLSIELADGVGVVPCTNVQLERILVNLVVNACDAMDRAGNLVIRTEMSPPSGDVAAHVRVSVIDDGSGMDEATRQNIFDPFFTTKGDAGTGLGLSTVYGIVTQTGGHVDVESKLGAGTAIHLSLPAEVVDETDDDAPSAFDPRRRTGEYQRLDPLDPGRFRKLMDGLDDAIYIADAETGRFADVNAAAVEMLGFPRAELLRMKPSDLKHGELRGGQDQWARQLRTLRASGSLTLSTVHRHASGTEVPVEIRVTLRETGGREYVIGVCRQRRGQKHSERPARSSNDDGQMTA